MLALHAVALALFALAIGGGAGALARPLVGLGFVLVACSYVVATRRPAPPAQPARATHAPRLARERSGEPARVSAAA